MTDYTTQLAHVRRELRLGADRHNQKLERLPAQLEFADKLCALHADRASEWQERIVDAGHVAGEALRQSSMNADEIIARAEETLEPIGKVAKEYALLCVSHAHMDMNWMWSWPETVAVTNDTFDTMRSRSSSWMRAVSDW